MSEVLINCGLRNEVGSNASHRVRDMGHVPAVIYGRYFTNQPIELDNKELNKIVRTYGENAVLNVNINGVTYPAIIKEVQRDPLTNEIIHLDLQQVYATEKIHAAVPVVLVGKERAEKNGILQQQLKRIDIECYPTNVPKFLSIDVSRLVPGHSLKISDVEFGEEISVSNNIEEVIVSMMAVKDELTEDDETESEVEAVRTGLVETKNKE